MAYGNSEGHSQAELQNEIKGNEKVMRVNSFLGAVLKTKNFWFSVSTF